MVLGKRERVVGGGRRRGGGWGNSHVAEGEWMGGFLFAESSHNNNTTRPAMSD